MGRNPAASMPRNPDYNPTSCLAHLVLCGTSGWALKLTSSGSCCWAFGTFSFLLGHGLLGVLRFGHPHLSDTTRRLYDQTWLAAEVLTLPLINVELYLHHQTAYQFALIHLAAALVPLTTQFVARSDRNDRVVDIVILGNVASLIYTAINYESPWAAGLAALTAINHFLFGSLSERFDVPKVDLVTIGLSFFNIFAVNCISEAKSNL